MINPSTSGYLSDMDKIENVAILGASNKTDRYSYKALIMLLEKEHNVYPVHPVLESINEQKVFPSLNDIDDEIHTLTVYVGPQRISPLIKDIINLNPGRVILNPGTESEELKAALEEAKIPYMEACTLVLLRTGQF